MRCMTEQKKTSLSFRNEENYADQDPQLSASDRDIGK